MTESGRPKPRDQVRALVTFTMSLVPKRELDQAVRYRKELEAERDRLEAEVERLIDSLAAAQEGVRKLNKEVVKTPAELFLLLLLEEEVRKAEHPMTFHRYDSNELQWILDRLVVVRCADTPVDVPCVSPEKPALSFRLKPSGDVP